MIRSMTSFGRGEYFNLRREYTVEVKSINHRYYDINVRLPKQYSFLEEIIRKTVPKYITRGKTDIIVVINDFRDNGKRVLFNEDLLKTLIGEANNLQEIYGIKNDLSFSGIVSNQDILRVSANEKQEELVQEFIIALNSALESSKNMREIEGRILNDDIIKKVEKINNLLKEIEERAPYVIYEYRTKLQARINELLLNTDVQLDENKINIEVAVFADKASIDEEITRFKSHNLQLLNTLESNEPVGKKLDFIIQELNREVNTIGSKANDLIITQHVIELKNIIEMIREQVQNIE